MSDSFVPMKTSLSSKRRMVSSASKILSGSLVIAAVLIAIHSGSALAQSTGNVVPSYVVLSSKPDEVVLRIEPKYRSQMVTGTDGRIYTEITYSGGIVRDSAGVPELPKLVLPFLAPSTHRASIDIISQALEVLPGIDLAPVPTRVKRNGEVNRDYVFDANRYNTEHYEPLFEAGPVSRFRTAYSEPVTISPIQYDVTSRTITRVKSLTIRIRFADAREVNAPADLRLSPEEVEFFHGNFVNSDITQFYGIAWSDARSAIGISRKVTTASSSGPGQWLQIETGDEGIYHVTAQDLAKAGVTGTIDTSTIELLGVGGEMLNEKVSTASGEWNERPIEIRMNGQTFSDLYFYAPGASVWKYEPSEGGSEGLYHNLNPYTSTGHFLLKIGGDRLGSDLRVKSASDSLSSAPTISNRVLTAVCRENDRKMENGNIGREMLDQDIPRSDVGSLQFTMTPPGYTGDSTAIRVAYDASNAANSGAAVAVQVNGQSVATLPVYASQNRVWDTAFVLTPSISSPLNFSLTFSSSATTAVATLDFVEMIYRRPTDIGSKSIPFFLLDNGGAYRYSFTGANGGELWDITNSGSPYALASASGDGISVALQGQAHAMRHFIAFSAQSVLAPNSITSISTPTLRSGLGTSGATEIIIAPPDFLDQANELKQLREQGGQATEAMSTAVVSTDDIYREFGYGNRDITAIRDFMAYMLRHANTRPVYLTLLGGGHCDYQNRETNAPNWIPTWEYEPMDFPPSFRTSIGIEPYPDDWYFVRLSPNAPDQQFDMSVGRISARTADEAEGYVQKVREYEHNSDSGSWRALSTFFADDRFDPEYAYSKDPLDHFTDTEHELDFIQDRVLVHKIYEVSYPSIITSGGERRRPAVEQAIVDAMNSGTVIFSFIGHGNPSVWTHESVLTVPSTITRMNNFDRLAYLTTGTCDFSEYDNFADFSGGEMFLLRPTGGAIGMLGTSRSVGGGEPLLDYFYQYLFQQAGSNGTATVGKALQYAKPFGSDPLFFYLLGDPAQRLLVPKLYVTFDSLNNQAMGAGRVSLPALSSVHLSGSIRTGSDATASIVNSFDGTVTVSLFDTPTLESATTTYGDGTSIKDAYWVEGPILYRGTATVTNGHFDVSFIVPRDVKLDTTAAKLSGYAYANDTRTALGDSRGIVLTSPDSTLSLNDTTPPKLKLYIGSRTFQSGDNVSMHSTAIVDVNALHGLNTSTASIGHTFIAWVDNAVDSAIDMASTYISKQNDYTSGTSVHPIELPAGHHTLHVRAFDTYDNVAFASVDFVAKDNVPYHLYELTTSPNPVIDHTVFSLTQPGNAGSLIRATLHIYTIDGRAIRTLTTETRESVVQIPWNGNDATGTTVANGIYAFTIDVDDLDDGTSSVATGKCIVSH